MFGVSGFNKPYTSASRGYRWKTKTAFIINRQILNTNLASDIVGVLKEFGLPVFKSRTTQRVIYAEALSTGTTVLDVEMNGQASIEIQNIVQELLELING